MNACLKLNEMLQKSNQNKQNVKHSTQSPPHKTEGGDRHRNSRTIKCGTSPSEYFLEILVVLSCFVLFCFLFSSIPFVLFLSYPVIVWYFGNLCVEKWIFIQWCCQQVNNNVNDNNYITMRREEKNPNEYTKSTISFLALNNSLI